MEPDDVSLTVPPATEAARLGVYALVRLGAYEPLASAVLDATGAPVARWWPVAYALQRVGDPRALPALTALAETPAASRPRSPCAASPRRRRAKAAAPVRQIIERRTAHPAVVIQAVRAAAVLGDGVAVPVLSRLVSDTSTDATLRLEAMTALAGTAGTASADLLSELMLDAAPGVRGQATRALARVDTEAFTATLSGLDPDRDWTVRTALATALGTLPEQRGVPRLEAMLADSDQRVVPAVVNALVAAKAANAERVATERCDGNGLHGRASAARGAGRTQGHRRGAGPAEGLRSVGARHVLCGRAAILSALSRLDPAAAAAARRGGGRR